MSDTPRTDAIAFSNLTADEPAYQMRKLCRKLERERTALRTSLEKTLSWAETYARFSLPNPAGPLAADIAEARRVLAETKGQP